MQFGIRLHDVNAGLGPEEQTMEARAEKAAREGFSCVHLAFSKVIKDLPKDPSALTEGLAHHTRRVFDRQGLDIAILGCYLNLAHPDPEELKKIQEKYYAHLRIARLCGAGVVGTETGAPNARYKLDENTHTEEALQIFLRGLSPVVEEAERQGVTLAIEPVWNHIVHTPERARRVLDSIGSRNLRIIFDPVNLLCIGNADEREKVFDDAMERLGDRIAVVHLKDFVRENGGLTSVAAGTGEMDYRNILRFMKAEKPYIQGTLENTSNENAESARKLLEQIYEEV